MFVFLPVVFVYAVLMQVEAGINKGNLAYVVQRGKVATDSFSKSLGIYSVKRQIHTFHPSLIVTGSGRLSV